MIPGKIQEFPKADHHNPWMGLDGKECKSPAYWCRMHEIWLSEDDAKRKRCFKRVMPFDRYGAERVCNCIEKKNFESVDTRKRIVWYKILDPERLLRIEYYR